MSMVLFANVTPEGITVQFDDGVRTVSADHPNFAPIVRKLQNFDTSNLLELIDLTTSVVRLSAGALQVEGNRVTYNGEPLPDEVASQWLTRAVQNNEDLAPITNYISRLMQNPDYHAVHGDLSRFLQANQYQLMEDGRIKMPKGVTDDFKDCHSRTVDYTPGNVVEIARHKVEKDPDKPCAPGLHVGNWNYAGGWGTTCIMCAVAPEDVVSIPAERDCPKLRACRLESLYRAYDLENERCKAETTVVDRPDYGPGTYTFEVVGLTDEGDFYRTEITVNTRTSCREDAEEEAVEEVASTAPSNVDFETLRVRQLIGFGTTDGEEYEVKFAALNDFGDRLVATKHVFADSDDEAIDIARSELTEEDFDIYTNPGDAKVIEIANLE